MDTSSDMPEEGAVMDTLAPPATSGVQRKQSSSALFYAKLVDAERLRKISQADQSDFVRLQAMTASLKLNPRRSSTVEWRSHLPANTLRETGATSRLDVIDEQPTHRPPRDHNENARELASTGKPEKKVSVLGDHTELLDNLHNPLTRFSETMKRHLTTEERKQHIAEALLCLRRELTEMRKCDYTLAKQLLRVRQQIHHVRLHNCYVQNKELLADALDQQDDEDEGDACALSDLPPRLFSPELKQIGLTPMNISIRRFSVF